MSEEEEELDKFLLPIQKSKRRTNKTAPEEDQPQEKGDEKGTNAPSDNESGIDPLELVDLPQQQRELLNWLSRHQPASFIDIQEASEIPSENLEEILVELVEKQRIHTVNRRGDTYYRVSFHGKASRRLRGFPEELWKKAGLDDE